MQLLFARVIKFILVVSGCVFSVQAGADNLAARPQLTGVGVESKVATGYGLYVVTMRASGSPGAISSFYLYSQNGSYPARWHEIDLEFTPGFTGIGSIIDPNHPHAIATGDCYSATSADNLPNQQACSVRPFLTGKAGADLSFNTYNYRAIDGEPYRHSNDQVFMPSNNGNDVFNDFYTYYIYYTPKGIYWTKDMPATTLTISSPTNLPTPSFVKKDFQIVANNKTWQPSNAHPEYQAFEYDALPLTPTLTNGSLADTGALMHLSMNLWDGTNTDPTHQQDWGGEVFPVPGASSAYTYVAYYPLTTPVSSVGNDPTQLNYGKAKIYSDFTKGIFLLNQQTTTFTTLWQVSNGQYLWPLGQLDARNLYCGHGALVMKISNNYASPRKNSDKFVNCDWLNQN